MFLGRVLNEGLEQWSGTNVVSGPCSGPYNFASEQPRQIAGDVDRSSGALGVPRSARGK